MTAQSVFNDYRMKYPNADSWALAWYLANEFCRRFYASHGIVPHVIDHEGLGFYGIQIDYLSCPVNGVLQPSLGRITAMGDVENWCTGSPGDHGLGIRNLYQQNVSTDKLTELAMMHLRIPILPEKSHLNCRHKRWGDSYKLLFEIATIVAIRENRCHQIWNEACYTERMLKEIDPQANMKEHPGAFLFIADSNTRQVLISGDGRVLKGGEGNLWERYMGGESVLTISLDVESWL